MVDNEVPLNHLGLKRYIDLDNKMVADAVGVSLRFHSDNGRREGTEEFDSTSLSDAEVGECILRGIEVKVTRSDFRAGFTCSGCNYHYLLTPMRLLAPSEVPRSVGLIEYNKHKWSCELNEANNFRPYKITGLRLLKPPKYRGLPRFQVDGVISLLAQRTLSQVQLRLINESCKP